jgi:protein-disulfide isomerase
MPSGKQSKRRRAAAAAAPPPVRGKGQRRQASPRVLIGAAALLVLIVVGVVLAVALGKGSSHTSSGKPLTGAAEVQRLLKGIPQHGNVLGSPSAPVTMVEYIDLQCPFCREFETQVTPTLIARYVRTGKVKVEARPLAFIGPDSQRGRAAALAVGRQNRLFDFTQLLYLNQGTENTGWLSADMVKRAAASIPGVNVSKLLADSRSSAVAAGARAIDTEAASSKISATPTILVGKSGKTLQQVRLASPTDGQAVVAAIEQALR